LYSKYIQYEMFEHFYLYAEEPEIVAAIAFLRDSYRLGSCSLTWEDPTHGMDVGIHLVRTGRSNEYYRDPYPVLCSVIAPQIPSFPEVSHIMDADAISKLITLLEAEAIKAKAEADRINAAWELQTQEPSNSFLG